MSRLLLVRGHEQLEHFSVLLTPGTSESPILALLDCPAYRVVDFPYVFFHFDAFSSVGILGQLLQALFHLAPVFDLPRSHLGDCASPLALQQLFKVLQLLLKAHVGEDHGSALADVAEGVVKEHALLLHQIGDHNGG